MTKAKFEHVVANPEEVTDWGERVEYWATEVSGSTFARDDAIRHMRAAGSSLRDIAKRAGMSHGAIAKIIGKG